MVKNFIEVLKDINEGEIWECTDVGYKVKYIEKYKDDVRIHSCERSKDIYIDLHGCKFKLKRKEYTFKEAFESFEIGKEIESVFSGIKYIILNGFEFNEYPYENGRSQAFKCIQFSTNEIRGGWYINE